MLAADASFSLLSTTIALSAGAGAAGAAGSAAVAGSSTLDGAFVSAGAGLAAGAAAAGAEGGMSAGFAAAGAALAAAAGAALVVVFGAAAAAVLIARAVTGTRADRDGAGVASGAARAVTEGGAGAGLSGAADLASATSATAAASRTTWHDAFRLVCSRLSSRPRENAHPRQIQSAWVHDQPSARSHARTWGCLLPPSRPSRGYICNRSSCPPSRRSAQSTSPHVPAAALARPDGASLVVSIAPRGTSRTHIDAVPTLGSL